jgi:hypothetical protein
VIRHRPAYRRPAAVKFGIRHRIEQPFVHFP